MEPPESIGAYRVLESLGRGAMGVVYRARHEVSGAEVALKTVHHPRVSSLAAIRREVHALSRLRHPQIVRIVDHGVCEGRVWYAMEPIRGPSLADRLDAFVQEPAADPSGDRDQRGPAPRGAAGARLAELLAIVRRLCDPLAYLHGEGLVHGDLKPSNVLFRQPDEPVLVDLGFVTGPGGGGGRERLAWQTFEAAGTPGYMAPERIRGETVDARADLYALGCILYEALVGEPPFAAFRDGHALLRAHLEQTPAPPSRIHAQLPSGLDELIRRLLAKDPRERLGHADDVARAIDRLGVAPPVPHPPSTPCARPYLYRASFQGRRVALRALARDLDAAHQGVPRAVVIAGESGVGKTRLVHEVARSAASHGDLVVAGECQRSADRSEPLHPLRPLLVAGVDRALELGTGGLERVFGVHLRLLARYEPLLLSLRGAAGWAEPAELSGEAARLRLLGALDHVAAALAERTPLVVLLDDLQSADELTLAWIDAVGRGLGHARRLLVLATYRADEPARGVDELLARGGAQRIDLAGFDRGEVAAMAGEMLAMQPPPAELVEFVARRSDGNPFFVSEYLRAALDEGLLERNEGAWRLRAHLDDALFDRMPDPDALTALVAGRLDQLAPGVRRLAEAGSVIGRSFDQELLQVVSALEDVVVLDGVATLLRHAVVEEAPDGALRFSHDQLREASYQRIPADDRRVLHRRAAEALAARAEGGPGARPDALTLAHHWERGGVAERAVVALDVAAVNALASGAPEVAIACVERARALAAGLAERPAAAARARWARLLGDAHFARGDLGACERSCVDALAAAGISLPTSEAGWGLLFARSFTRQLVHRSLPRRLLTAGARDPEALENAALAAVRLSERHLYSGRPLPLAAASPLAVNLAERSGRPMRVSRAYAGTGFLARVNKMGALSRGYFRAAEELATTTGDVEGLAFARMCQAAAAAGEGRWDEALTGIERGLAAAREIGDAVQTATLETLRGHVEFFRGELLASRASFESVLASALRRGNQQHRAWGLVGLGRALDASGDRAGASSVLREALTVLAAHPDFPVELMARGILAATHAVLGELGSSASEVERADAMIASTLPSLFATSSGYVGSAEAHLLAHTAASESGERVAAAAAMRRARRALRAVTLHARVFPVGQPARLRLAGELARARGDLEGARTYASEAAERARVLGMKIDEALARIPLARLARHADEREWQRARALELLDACGAASRWGGLA